MARIDEQIVVENALNEQVPLVAILRNMSVQQLNTRLLGRTGSALAVGPESEMDIIRTFKKVTDEDLLRRDWPDILREKGAANLKPLNEKEEVALRLLQKLISVREAAFSLTADNFTSMRRSLETLHSYLDGSKEAKDMLVQNVLRLIVQFGVRRALRKMRILPSEDLAIVMPLDPLTAQSSVEMLEIIAEQSPRFRRALADRLGAPDIVNRTERTDPQ